MPLATIAIAIAAFIGIGGFGSASAAAPKAIVFGNAGYGAIVTDIEYRDADDYDDDDDDDDEDDDEDDEDDDEDEDDEDQDEHEDEDEDDEEKVESKPDPTPRAERRVTKDRADTVPNYCRCFGLRSAQIAVTGLPKSCKWLLDSNKVQTRVGICSVRRRLD